MFINTGVRDSSSSAEQGKSIDWQQVPFLPPHTRPVYCHFERRRCVSYMLAGAGRPSIRSVSRSLLALSSPGNGPSLPWRMNHEAGRWSGMSSASAFLYASHVAVLKTRSPVLSYLSTSLIFMPLLEWSSTRPWRCLSTTRGWLGNSLSPSRKARRSEVDFVALSFNASSALM